MKDLHYFVCRLAEAKQSASDEHQQKSNPVKITAVTSMPLNSIPRWRLRIVTATVITVASATSLCTAGSAPASGLPEALGSLCLRFLLREKPKTDAQTLPEAPSKMETKCRAVPRGGGKAPFRDAIFDAVFHVGGINFFNDRARAIAEMIRVAKPGTKIVIVDETEKVVKDVYEKTPLTRRYFEKRETAVTSPVDLVPRTMLDTTSKEIGGGRLYCLSFRKP